MLLADLPHELVHDHLQGGGHPGFGHVLVLGGVRVEGQVVEAHRPCAALPGGALRSRAWAAVAASRTWRLSRAGLAKPTISMNGPGRADGAWAAPAHTIRLTPGVRVARWPTAKLAGTPTAATIRNFTSGGQGSPRTAIDSPTRTSGCRKYAA